MLHADFAIVPAPREPNLITSMPSKNKEFFTEWRRYTMYYIIRFLPSIAMWLFVFVILLQNVNQPGYSSPFVMFNIKHWGDGPANDALRAWYRYDISLLAIQNYSLLLYVVSMVVSNLSFVSKVHSIIEVNVFTNTTWMMIASLALVLQLVFCIISTNGLNPGEFIHWNRTVTNLLFSCIAWPFAVFILDEIVKKNHREFFVRANALALFEFQTVLGMHSPV
jgi:uncharacterized Tic20 family protein